MARAFDLLEFIAGVGGACSLRELSDGTALPPPTIHRILRTLSSSGYVVRSSDRHYALGPRLIGLGELADRQVGAVAGPALQALAHEVGESVALGVLDGDKVTYTSHVSSGHSLRIAREPGERTALHVGGAGKAVLADMNNSAVTAALQRISESGPILAEVEEIRLRGYAVDDQGYALGVRSMAMAVPGAQTPMAVEIAGPVCRVDADFIETAVPALARTVAAIADIVAGPRADHDARWIG